MQNGEIKVYNRITHTYTRTYTHTVTTLTGYIKSQGPNKQVATETLILILLECWWCSSGSHPPPGCYWRLMWRLELPRHPRPGIIMGQQISSLFGSLWVVYLGACASLKRQLAVCKPKQRFWVVVHTSGDTGGVCEALPRATYWCPYMGIGQATWCPYMGMDLEAWRLCHLIHTGPHNNTRGDVTHNFNVTRSALLELMERVCNVPQSTCYMTVCVVRPLLLTTVLYRVSQK